MTCNRVSRVSNGATKNPRAMNEEAARDYDYRRARFSSHSSLSRAFRSARLEHSDARRCQLSHLSLRVCKRTHHSKRNAAFSCLFTGRAIMDADGTRAKSRETDSLRIVAISTAIIASASILVPILLVPILFHHSDGVKQDFQTRIRKFHVRCAFA